MNILKKNMKKIIECIGYFVIFAPMMFCIYYAVPASDDFAAAARVNGGNIFSQSVYRGFSMWADWGGRWLSQIVQMLINPLNSHQHLGHKYGIYMIVVFLITTILTIYGLKAIVRRVLGKNDKFVNTVTFLIILLLYSTYYYSECFNFYVGAMVYPIPVSLAFVTIAAMIYYNDRPEKKTKYYWIMVVAGIFPATIETCDVLLGITYLYYIYYLNWNERKSESLKLKIKHAFPLLLYIALGVSCVLSPGNFARREYYNLESSFVRSFIQTVIDIVIRVQDLLVDHPFAVIILILFIVIGIVSNKEFKKPVRVIETAILFIIITFGAMLPYIYGRDFRNTYLDIRMEYILDYCIEIGFAFMCIYLGQWLAYKFEISLSGKEKVGVTAALLMFVYVTLIQNYAYLNIVQIDILRNKGLIQESYAFWDGVMLEIENSEDDDVVIYRDKILPWSRYCFEMGLTDGDTYSVDPSIVYDKEYIMPNVYYGKKSITLYYKNHD